MRQPRGRPPALCVVDAGERAWRAVERIARLLSVARDRGVDHLVVCGFTTSGCVRATVVDAASCHYTVTVVADGCADRLPLSHDVALLDVDTRYGDVVSAVEAEAILADPAGRP